MYYEKEMFDCIFHVHVVIVRHVVRDGGNDRAPI